MSQCITNNIYRHITISKDVYIDIHIHTDDNNFVHTFISYLGQVNMHIILYIYETKFITSFIFSKADSAFKDNFK